jgi:hypothetical protein
MPIVVINEIADRPNLLAINIGASAFLLSLHEKNL